MVVIATNIVVCAFTPDAKSDIAAAVPRRADIASNHLGNEYATVMRRTFAQPWCEIERRLDLLHDVIPLWHAVELADTRRALHLADRYQLQFYDALKISVAAAQGATTLFSDDMQHGLVIDDALTIVTPFLPEPA